MPRKTHRDRFRPIISRVLAEHKGQPWAMVAKALREAFPMGERRYWPYKMWLKEIRVQRGLARFRRPSIYTNPYQPCLFPLSD